MTTVAGRRRREEEEELSVFCVSVLFFCFLKVVVAGRPLEL